MLTTLEAAVVGELWCVFGCGGDRDRGKRPMMGAVAADLADRIVLTDDNPRSEDPARDRRARFARVSATTRASTSSTTAAPRSTTAIERARPGDVVLVAGKGHEAEQLVGAERRAFSDRAVVAELLGAAP